MNKRQLVSGAMALGIFGGLMIDTWLQAHPTTVAYAREPEEKVIQITTVIDWTPERIEKEISTKAAEYGVSAKLMRDLIQCESMGSTTIQSFHVRNGVREQSFGLAQINLPSHPNVTREQAIDPEFAIDFMAKNIAAGKASMWSCLKMI